MAWILNITLGVAIQEENMYLHSPHEHPFIWLLFKHDTRDLSML